MKKIIYFFLSVSIFLGGCKEIIPDKPPIDTTDTIDIIDINPVVRDTIPPWVVATNPSDSAVGVPLNVDITINFSEPVSPTTALVKLLIGDTIVNCTIVAKNSEITISPLDSFLNSITYTVIVPAFVSDTVGNSLGKEYLWSFTTKAKPLPAPWVIQGSGNPQIMAVAADNNSNIYVSGTFYGPTLDCFVARFNPDGQLSWRQNISTTGGDYPRWGLGVSNGKIYVAVWRNETYGTMGEGAVYAFSAENGQKEWDVVCEAWGGLVAAEDGNIYSIAIDHVTKLSPNGQTLGVFKAPAGVAFSSVSVSAANGDIFVIGNIAVPGSYFSAKTWKLDAQMNIIWEYQDGEISPLSSGQAIMVYPETGFIFIGKSRGGLDAEPWITSYGCYRLTDSGIEKLWEKDFDGNLHIGFVRSDEGFIVFTHDIDVFDPTSRPVKLSPQGDLLWSSPKLISGPIAVSNGKIFTASFSAVLTVLPE